MKVVIEIEIPDGQGLPDPRDIVRLTSPDWHCDWWHYSDVQSVAEDLSDDEAREVLQIMAHKSDCNVGINWDSIGAWADWVREDRPEQEDVVYGFLCEDPNNHDAMFGIEYSMDEDGNGIFETEWCSTSLSRDLQVQRKILEGVVFPRGKA